MHISARQLSGIIVEALHEVDSYDQADADEIWKELNAAGIIEQMLEQYNDDLIEMEDDEDMDPDEARSLAEDNAHDFIRDHLQGREIPGQVWAALERMIEMELG
jgi:hypothetical protein